MQLMNFLRKCRGSISIFLCIILLPMVTYATMILDASRLQAAKTAISGAGDLVLNAAMSEYDVMLKDMYGLFSVVQNEDDLEEALESYFRQTIEGGLKNTGTSDATIQQYAKEIASWVLQIEEDGELNFDNLLKMQVNDMKIGGVSSSALANPAVLKRQITEYMKYKGPVSLATTLLSKLDFLKNSSAQTEVLEQKVEYATSLNDVQEASDNAYDMVKSYNNAAHLLNELRKNYGLEKAVNKLYTYCYNAVYAAMLSEYCPYVINDFRAQMSSGTHQSLEPSHVMDDYELTNDQMDSMKAEEILKEIKRSHDKLLEYIDYTKEGKTSMFEKVGGEVYLEYNEEDPSQSIVRIKTITGRSDSFDYYDLIETEKTTSTHRNAIRNANKDIDDKKLMDNLDQYYIDQLNITYKFFYQYCDDYTRSVDYFGQFYSLINREFQKYESALISELEKNGKSAEDAKKEIKENSDYKEMKKMNESLKILYKFFSDYGNTDSVKYKIDLLLDCFSDTETYLYASVVYMDKASGILEPFSSAVSTAVNCISIINSYLDKVIDAMVNAEREKSEWKSSLDGVSDGTTKASMQSDYETSTDGIDVREVQKLKTVVDADLAKLQALKNDIENISFINKKLMSSKPSKKEITDAVFLFMNANGLHDSLKIKEGNLIADLSLYTFGFMNPGINNTYMNAQTLIYSFRLNLNYINSGVSYYDNTSGTTVFMKPEIHPDAGYLDGYVDNPPFNTAGIPDENEKFAITLKSISDPFKNVRNEDETKEQKNQADNINKLASQGEDARNESEDNSKDDNGKNDDKDDKSKNDKENSKSELLENILKSVNDYCKAENIVVTEDSDTQDTSTAKGIKVDSNSKDGYGEQGKNSSAALGQSKSILSALTNITTTAVEYAYLEEYFTEMFSCDTDRMELEKNKSPMVTLSGTTLDPNNPWYGKEVEYILWGNSDLDANITANYAMIYLIRFALNCIYAFTAADIQSFALEIATAIAGWTVVGVPIVQAVITIGLALAESGIDIFKLSQGESVPIYKNASSFVCSPSGFVSTVVKDAASYAAQKVTNYVCDRIDDVVDDLKGTVSDNMEKLKDYANTLATNQTEQIKTQVTEMFVTPLINKLTPVLNEAQKGVSNVQQLVNNAVDDAINTVKQNIDAHADGPIKTIELEAFKWINSSDIKNGFISKLNSYFEKVKEKVSAQNIEKIITNYMDMLKTKIDDKVKEYTNKIKDQLIEKFNNMLDKPVSEVKSVVNEKINGFADQMAHGISEKLSSKVSDMTESTTSGGFALNYKEYCKIFVFIKIVANQDSMLQHCAALIEANIRSTDGHEKFSIKDAFSVLYIDADIKINTMFPWGVETAIDDVTGDTSSSWNPLRMGVNELTVKYNAINGY